MEILDWIDLFEAEPELLRQYWTISPLDGIRNEDGQCPLCAWAALQTDRASEHRVAWHFALREVFDMDADFGDASIIADGADIPLARTRVTYPEAFFARQLLLELFKLKEPV